MGSLSNQQHSPKLRVGSEVESEPRKCSSLPNDDQSTDSLSKDVRRIGIHEQRGD